MSTLRLPPKATRNPWFVDIDGYFARTKLEDETLTETIDFTQELESGETVSTATWDDVSGPTITGTAVSSPNVTFTVTDAGDATLVAVTSASRTLRRRMRWISQDTTSWSDYR